MEAAGSFAEQLVPLAVPEHSGSAVEVAGFGALPGTGPVAKHPRGQEEELPATCLGRVRVGGVVADFGEAQAERKGKDPLQAPGRTLERRDPHPQGVGEVEVVKAAERLLEQSCGVWKGRKRGRRRVWDLGRLCGSRVRRGCVSSTPAAATAAARRGPVGTGHLLGQSPDNGRLSGRRSLDRGMHGAGIGRELDGRRRVRARSEGVRVPVEVGSKVKATIELEKHFLASGGDVRVGVAEVANCPAQMRLGTWRERGRRSGKALVRGKRASSWARVAGFQEGGEGDGGRGSQRLPGALPPPCGGGGLLPGQGGILVELACRGEEQGHIQPGVGIRPDNATWGAALAPGGRAPGAGRRGRRGALGLGFLEGVEVEPVASAAQAGIERWVPGMTAQRTSWRVHLRAGSGEAGEMVGVPAAGPMHDRPAPHPGRE